MANCTQCGRKLPAFSFRKICDWCIRHEAAQRGEEPEDAIQPVMPTPWSGAGTSPMMVTQALFGLNIGVFILMAFYGNAMDFSTQQLVASGANYGPLTLGGEPWRLVTSMFLHGGLLHILVNMWCLWNLGAACEGLDGHATYATVYLVSGIGGSLASVWWHPMIPSVGASGAIFGIVGALIASYYLGDFNMPRFVVSRELRTILIFAGYSLVLGPIFGRRGGGVDNAAHLGGLITGLALGALIALVAPERKPFRRIAVVGTVSLIVLACGARLYQTRSYLVHASRGEQLLVEKKPEQAIAEIQSSIRQRPDYLPTHFALAHAYFNLQRYAEAEAELRRVLQLRPSYEPALYELGMALLNQNKTQDARKVFEQCAVLVPDDGHYGLGLALAQEGNDKAAVEEYQQALQFDADASAIYYRLGISQARLKNYDAAIDAFRKQQQVDGDNYDTELALASAYRAKGMAAEADAAIKKAGNLKPAN